MTRLLRTAVAVAVAASATLSLAADIPTCGPGKACPEATPCCSQYGQCGVGAYCLGGCDPLFSHSLDSCVPAPVCKDQDYKFTNLDNAQSINKYLGDASKADWVYSGNPVIYDSKSLMLTMAPDTVGTLFASTHYVWYGKISAKLTTSQGKGVVTAFIMMSDVKDEIDFEFVGVDLENAQTNFYSQGVTNYNNGGKSAVSNTVSNEHEYTIDWTPDSIVWSVDGKEIRTKKRSETWNATSNRYDFPQTPSRVMLSLWPAGLPSNGEGTITWGGGLVDWNSAAMTNGYYYAMISEVSVECYDPPSGYKSSGSKSYVYTDAAGTNNTVEITDKEQILASLYATGENPDNDPTGTKGSKSSSASGAASTSALPETVPGVSGAGAASEGSSSGSSGSGSSGDSSESSSAASSSSTSSSGSGFSQGTSGNSGTSGASMVTDRSVGGSICAVIVAVFALLVI